MSKRPVLLVINSGSSSIKFAVFDYPQLTRLYSAQISELYQPQTQLKISGSAGELSSQSLDSLNHQQGLTLFLDWLNQQAVELLALGHRVVHGGCVFNQPCLITPDVFQQLETLIPLAPLHQPHNLAAIQLLQQQCPDIPQVACFDTAFHQTQPELAQRYALPDDYFEQGVRAYGFHGLSYQYISSILSQHLNAQQQNKVIVAHLGNGASLCALAQGKSIATTMGFTPLDGLVMGTRCGSIDPGVLLYLLRQGKTVDQLERLLSREAGLLGLSGSSSDMAVLLQQNDVAAQRAIQSFCYRVVRHIGSLVAALGGLDSLIFTGGIGEHAPLIRAEICRQLVWLGVEIDEVANQSSPIRISHVSSPVAVCVMATDEEKLIAQQSLTLLSSRVIR